MEDQVIFDDCIAMAATDQALLVYIRDLERTVWIPQSQITEDSEVYRVADEGKLVITAWFASKKGLV